MWPLHSPGTGLSTITEQGNLLRSRTTTSSPALDQVGSIGALFRRKPTSPDFSMQDHSNPGILMVVVTNARSPIHVKMWNWRLQLLFAMRVDCKGCTPPYFENQMLSTQKTHIKHRFADMNEKGNTICKFVCQAYWTTQFVAVRRAFCGNSEEDEIGYTSPSPWLAHGMRKAVSQVRHF